MLRLGVLEALCDNTATHGNPFCTCCLSTNHALLSLTWPFLVYVYVDAAMYRRISLNCICMLHMCTHRLYSLTLVHKQAPGMQEMSPRLRMSHVK